DLNHRCSVPEAHPCWMLFLEIAGEHRHDRFPEAPRANMLSKLGFIMRSRLSINNDSIGTRVLFKHPHVIDHATATDRVSAHSNSGGNTVARLLQRQGEFRCHS